VDKDVCRLDVAVYDALGVEVGDAFDALRKELPDRALVAARLPHLLHERRLAVLHEDEEELGQPPLDADRRRVDLRHLRSVAVGAQARRLQHRLEEPPLLERDLPVAVRAPAEVALEEGTLVAAGVRGAHARLLGARAVARRVREVGLLDPRGEVAHDVLAVEAREHLRLPQHALPLRAVDARAQLDALQRVDPRVDAVAHLVRRAKGATPEHREDLEVRAVPRAVGALARRPLERLVRRELDGRGAHRVGRFRLLLSGCGRRQRHVLMTL